LQVVIRSNLLCVELESLEDGSTQCSSDNGCRAVASTSSAAAAATAAAVDIDDNDDDDDDYDGVEPEDERQANATSRPNKSKYSKYVI